MNKPNFLFLIADDHRFSALGGLGHENVSTPTFDKLMDEGTTFTRAHIMGSTSGAVCMPSRGMLMTGRNLFQTPDPLPVDTPLLPEWLWQNGYTTFGTGKWHNRPETFARSFSTGGKVFFGGMTDDQFAIIYNEFDPSRAYDEQAVAIADIHATTLFVDETINFLNEHQPDDEPFFAYCAFTSPHDPRTAPEPFASMYNPDEIELPPNYMQEHSFDLGNHDIRDEVLAAQPRDDAEVRQHIADYYGMISHMDYEIGRILETLHDKGLAENTIVIYTSDHGLSVGQHGLLGKQNLYDHSIRIPMILRGPDIEAGKVSDALCYLYDLFPTICERAGVVLPETNEGHSLNTLLSGTTDAHRHSIFAAYQNIFGHPEDKPYQRMIRGERFKLIQSYLDDTVTTQLFDIEADPYETQDLHEDRQYYHVLKSLEKRLHQWQSVVNDPLLS
jgi:arylsulfatase A-like enzyme